MALIDPAQAYISKIHAQHKASLAEVNEDSNIVPAYCNTTVLITGVGFLGRHLLEKLFRCCNIKKAYLLMRPKKGKAIQERLAEIIKDSIFDDLRSMQPSLETRLVPVLGDAKELRLGIADDDWNILTEEIEYIFHAAATVNFEEHIQMATLTNVRGTREIVALGKASKKLKALVHISTAFCQANRDRIGLEVREEFYPAPMSPDLLINMAESLPADVLKDMTNILLQKWPNTYTFTKAVAEEVMRLASEELPVSIVRPAIVINAFREPVPGWLDPSSVYGPSGVRENSAFPLRDFLTGLIKKTKAAKCESDSPIKGSEVASTII